MILSAITFPPMLKTMPCHWCILIICSKEQEPLKCKMHMHAVDSENSQSKPRQAQRAVECLAFGDILDTLSA